MKDGFGFGIFCAGIAVYIIGVAVYSGYEWGHDDDLRCYRRNLKVTAGDMAVILNCFPELKKKSDG